MLKAIELWDFESHEHSRIEGLSEGLNVVCGPSNSGKTSLVRALKLVAYNDFDPKSVRVGAKKCKVRVETDRGWVQVTRGKDDNLWEITPTGEKTKYRDKVGRVDPPPEAVEILGLGKVTLGDIPVPVNIMDQLESHFMLAGIGNKDATGSVRAQIIDEISGLSGIEGIIKEVSLDNRRAKREVKQSEEQMEEISSQLHDEAGLDAEAVVLTAAEEHLKNHQDATEAVTQAKDMQSQGHDLDEQVDETRAELKTLPDGKAALLHLDNAQSAMDVVEVAIEMKEQSEAVASELKRAESALKACPDHQKATRHLDKAKAVMDKRDTAQAILDTVHRASEEVADAKKRLSELPKTVKVEEHLKKAQAALDTAKEARAMMREASSVGKEVRENEDCLARNMRNRELVQEHIDSILKTVKVCPLNPNHPVSPECLKETT